MLASGGRDLSGNKRTNKLQSFDQKFDKLNEALRVSCFKGYPVRVVRSVGAFNFQNNRVENCSLLFLLFTGSSQVCMRS